MVKRAKYLLFLLIPLLGFISCDKENPSPDVPVFTYNETILNPPDTFKVVYNLRTVINYQAVIQFQDDAVWKIEKLNSFTARFWINNPSNSETLLITNSQNVGLQGNKDYYFYASNNSSQEDRKLYILFTRLNENYDTFENKF